MTEVIQEPTSARSSKRLSKHEGPKLEQAAIQDLPYPQYSLLRDGKEGAFLPQVIGEDAAKRVYKGWANVALHSAVGTNTSLVSILEHLQTTLIPPPGVPKIDRVSAIIPYLEDTYNLSGLTGSSTDGEEVKVDEGSLFLQNIAVRQPTWEEISEIWKSVGMSFLRWGLIALEVPCQTYVASNGAGQPSCTNASGSSSGPTHEQALKQEHKPRTPPPPPQARPPILDFHLPDSAFNIKHHSELPYPELSMRRTMDDPQLLTKPGESSSNHTNGTAPQLQSDVKAEAGTEVKPKVKKKAFYAGQITGEKGSTAVALTWIRAMLVVDDTACEKFTRLDSVYEVYKGYTYHPPGCPPLPLETFLDRIHNLREFELIEDLNGFVSTSSVSRPLDPLPIEMVTNTPISQPHSSTSTSSTSTQTQTQTRPELIRGTLRPPEKVIQKMHESIWETVGMSWKRAKPYGWTEQGIMEGREKERRETERKTEVIRRRMQEEKQARANAMERDGAGVSGGRTSGVEGDRAARPDGKRSGLLTSQAYVPRRDAPNGGGSNHLPSSNSSVPFSYPTTQLPKQPDPVPRVAPEDFVLLWLSRTYKRSSWSAEVTQKDLWTSYSALVQRELIHYETRMRNYNSPRPVIINGVTSTHIPDATQESGRLAVMYNVICHYMRLRPGDVFGIVTEMFGAQLGRNGRGEYTIQGLEVVSRRIGG